MDLKDMSKVRRQLILAMMLADMWKEEKGILITRDTKLRIDEKIYHLEGEGLRVKEGSIVTLGTSDKDSSNFLVISINSEEITLEKSTFFKAKTSCKFGVDTYCVFAKDSHDAYKVLKDYCKRNNKDIDRILSVNPCNFFEPVVTRLN